MEKGENMNEVTDITQMEKAEDINELTYIEKLSPGEEAQMEVAADGSNNVMDDTALNII